MLVGVVNFTCSKGDKNMSFTFNNLNGSSKPNATVACSPNSTTKVNLNTTDDVKRSGEKCHIDCTANGSKSDSNSSLFVFGNHSQKNFDFKTSEGFNLVLNSNSFDPSSGKSSTDLSKLKLSADINLFNIKEKMESKLEDKTRAELNLDNINENLNENSNENCIKDEELNDQEQKRDDNVPNGEVLVVKTIVAEFKDVISGFIKERIEGENKIAALEDRITTLEQEVRNLKTQDSKESSTTGSTNDNHTTHTSTISITQQPPEQPPVVLPRQIPSPALPPPTESFNFNGAFQCFPPCFGSSSAPVFTSGLTSSFGSASKLLTRNDSTTKTSVFNPSTTTQAHGGNQLFGATIPSSSLNGKSLGPERKKANTQKLFSHEAVTNFSNAQKEPSMNNNSLTKINFGNSLKKMANGQESLEQNQNIPPKEAFETHLQKTIEFSIKKAMEEYWEPFKSNTSEANFKKFNSGNMF